MVSFKKFWLKYALHFLTFFLCSHCFADNTWQYHWEKGYDLFSKSQHQDATSEFDQAICMMSEDEQNRYPYVLVYRAESDYFLQNYKRILDDTEKALNSRYLTEMDRLTCGMRRIAVFMQLGDENNSVEEYKKYIIGCPLFPKYDYTKEKIIVRNLPDCEFCRETTKQFMTSQFCKETNDISEYDNMWIINITKDCNCSSDQLPKISNPILSISKRGPAEIQACCNSVNRCAVAANVICGCITTPYGPGVDVGCKVTCAVFVEALREAGEWCCNNGGIEENCWEKFKTWKVDFQKKNPKCPKPPEKCP